MKKKEKTVQESMDNLNELIRVANSLISPISVHDNLKWLMDRNLRKKHFEQYPKCYLSMNIGAKNFSLPICNRSGIEDPNIISFSKKVINRMADRNMLNSSDIIITLKRLDMLERKFSKPIPKPQGMAARKGKVTKTLNQIKQLLHSGD